MSRPSEQPPELPRSLPSWPPPPSPLATRPRPRAVSHRSSVASDTAGDSARPISSGAHASDDDDPTRSRPASGERRLGGAGHPYVNTSDVDVPEYILRRAVIARARSERQIAEAVTAARHDGMSWARIGKELGVSAQAAQQRYGHARASELTDHPEDHPTTTTDTAPHNRDLPPVSPAPANRLERHVMAELQGVDGRRREPPRGPVCQHVRSRRAGDAQRWPVLQVDHEERSEQTQLGRQ